MDDVGPREPEDRPTGRDELVLALPVPLERLGRRVVLEPVDLDRELQTRDRRVNTPQATTGDPHLMLQGELAEIETTPDPEKPLLELALRLLARKDVDVDHFPEDARAVAALTTESLADP